MSSVGIVCAKENSNRFPNKNIHELDGVPMFWHAVKPLLDSERINAVYVSTDSAFIRDYCNEAGVRVIFRTANATHDEEPLLGVLNYTYKSIEERYDNIVTIMANCPKHTIEAVDKAIEMIDTNEYSEIRSFNEAGEESGLMVFKEKIILQALQISSHIGFLKSNVKEIHHKSDLDAK